MTVKTLYVDNSILSTMARCSTKAQMRYVLDYTTIEESAALKGGTAAHAILADWLKGSPRISQSWDEVPEWLDFAAWGEDNVPEGDGWHPGVVDECLLLYMKQHPINTLPFRVEPQFVEIGFAYPLDDNGDIIYTGRLDAAGQDPKSDHWYAVDWKTTKSISGDKRHQYRMDSQMLGYTWVLGQILGEPSILGCLVGLIEMRALPEVKYKKNGEAYKCPTHTGIGLDQCRELHTKSEWLWESYSPEQLAQWRESALTLARRYARLVAETGQGLVAPQEGYFNGSCNFCEFRPYCEQGRSEMLLEIAYKKEKWQPWDIESAR